LYFIVPDIAPGAYELTLNIADKHYEVDYSINGLPPIVDPVSFLQEKLTDLQFTNEELNVLKSKATDYPESETRVAQLEMVKAIYSEMNARFASASMEEREIAAKFMVANPELFSKPELYTDLTGHELFRTTSTHTAESIARELDQKINKACALIIAGGLATAAILDFAPAQWKLTAGITGGATAGLL